MIAPIRPSQTPHRAAAARKAGGTPSSGGFAATETTGGQSTAAAAGTVATSSISSIDAVMALQAVDDPAGRRAKAVRRGHRLLDDLDELKLGLLEGRMNEGKLGRLVATVSANRDGTDDPGLEDVLDGIELRAKVELAKLGR